MSSYLENLELYGICTEILNLGIGNFELIMRLQTAKVSYQLYSPRGMDNEKGYRQVKNVVVVGGAQCTCVVIIPVAARVCIQVHSTLVTLSPLVIILLIMYVTICHHRSSPISKHDQTPYFCINLRNAFVKYSHFHYSRVPIFLPSRHSPQRKRL